LPSVIFRGLALRNITAFAVDPKDSQMLYAAMQGRLFKSRDGGRRWEILSDTVNHELETVRVVSVSPHNSNTVVCITRYSYAFGDLDDIYRSTDGGKTWRYATGGFWVSSHGVQIEIAFDPVDSMKMYATGDNSFDVRFYISTDGGINWRDISYLDGSSTQVLINNRQRNRMHIFHRPERTEDAGYSWNLTSDGLPRPSVVFAAIDAKNPSTLFASYAPLVYDPNDKPGVYATRNGGDQWEILPGSSNLPITYSDIAPEPRNVWVDTLTSVLYVGTSRGLFSFRLAVSVEKEENLPSTFHLYQNYPNPFNPTTTIKYTLPEKIFVHLSVYDILGKEVRTLVKEQQNAGTHSVEFDGERLPSGVYFYRLTAGTKTFVRKAVLMK
jgi:photosystem II stability/assembly factor-like uncharacterized protein